MRLTYFSAAFLIFMLIEQQLLLKSLRLVRVLTCSVLVESILDILSRAGLGIRPAYEGSSRIVLVLSSTLVAL
jgi:hypothetical protein